jgi:sugar lactone lactonase YvrE
MEKVYQAELLLESSCRLGEGPVWCSSTNAIYWVDIEGRTINWYCLDTQIHHFNAISKRVGMVALTNTPYKLLLGLQGSLCWYDVKTSYLELWRPMEAHLTYNRCNDGQIDLKGRLWVGTMQIENQRNEGNLYCISATGEQIHLMSKLGISNGMAWSQDGQYFFFIDSLKRNIRRFEIDEQNALVLTKEKVIYQSRNRDELPDGMCIDANGNLWVAFWGGFRVACIDTRTGEELAEIRLPVPNVTSCNWIGPNFNELVITTAREGLDEHELLTYPMSGHIFRCKVDAQGIETRRFVI